MRHKFHLGCLYIFQLHIADRRQHPVVSRHKGFPLIKHIRFYTKYTFAHISGLYIFQHYVFHITATPFICFYKYQMIHFGICGHPAIQHIHIFDTARQLRTDGKQLMSVFYITIADNQITGRLFQAPCIVVATRFYGNCIVALIEYTILHQRIFSHFRVVAIVVVSVRIHIQFP